MPNLELATPFDNSALDEAAWRQMARMFCGSGPVGGYLNDMAVYADGTGTRVVKVQTGACIIRGVYGENQTEKQITMPTNSTGTYNNRIVARLDTTTRTISVECLQGGTSVYPALAIGPTQFDIPLADVQVTNGYTTVAAGAVSDRRQLLSDPSGSGWFGYTPSVVGIVLNGGSLAGRYRIDNGTCYIAVTFLAGASAPGGTNPWGFGLPPGAKAASPSAYAEWQMHLKMYDSDGYVYIGTAGVARGATTCGLYSHGTVGLNNTTPFPWGANDNFVVTGFYEI